MMRFFILAQIFIVSHLLAAENLSSGLIVKAIEVESIGRAIDKEYVLSHVGSKTNEIVDYQQVSKDIKALMGTGRFSDVQVEAVKAGEDIHLVFRVVPRRRLTERPTIIGVNNLSEMQVANFAKLTLGDYIDEKAIQMAVNRIIAEYKKRHYQDVEVKWDIKPVGDGQASVTFKIREGGRTKVSEIRFDGNTIFAPSKLASFFERPVWWNPFSWFGGKKYDEGIIQSGRERVADLYRKEGYRDVKVGEAIIERADRGGMAIVVPVTEGKKFYFGTVRFEGVTKFPESMLRNAAGGLYGKPAGVQAEQDARQAVRDYYGSRGYVDTFVRAVPVPNATNDFLDITFVVNEGELANIRNINISGNVRTKDEVIRREIEVAPGDIFDEVKVRISEKKLSNLGYFSSVRSYPMDTPFNDEKDLVFELEEQRTGQLMVGAGFSSVDNVMAFAEISQGNFDLFNWPSFTGGGQKLKLSGQLGKTRRGVELSFIEPWFLDKKLTLGVDLYVRKYSYDEYETTRTGAETRLSKPLFELVRGEISYGIERLDITDVADTNRYEKAGGNDYFFQRDEDVVSSRMGTALVRDSRDNPFVPKTGSRMRLYTSVSGGALGFDTDLYQVGFSAWKYFPLWRGHVFSMMLSYEVVDNYGRTDEVPLDDRLFAGGGRTLRGFRYRDVGPKVTRDVEFTESGTTTYHKPIGGCSRALGKAEYTIPLVNMIRFACFFDIGNVWEDAYDFDASSLAMSAGAGLRFDVPGFPIRIDYARALEKDSALTRTDNWVFWIGYDY